jgi:hypothetical protein
MKLTDIQRDRAVGALVGLAAGDALGADYKPRTSGRYSRTSGRSGPLRAPMRVPLKSSGLSNDLTSEARKITRSGFPHRRVIEDAIVQLLRERDGSVKIRTRLWNIYDELGERLGVPIRARQRPTSTTGEPAWRPEVGFARKNLELRGVITPTLLSGRGVWRLAQH